MTKRRADIETLNAYVDGELPAGEAAAVAAEIAGDPRTGQVVANLHGMKAAVATAFDIGGPELRVAPRPRPLMKPAVAACLLLAAGAIAWFVLTANSGGSSLADRALKVHDAWQPPTAERTEPASYPYGPTVPDLTAAGLRIDAVQPTVRLGPVEALRVAYVGSRGCRLSFYAFDAQKAAPETASRRDEDALVERWSVGDHGYLLVARKMNADRFDVIAAALRQSTERAAPVSGGMRTAMSQARQPCRA